MYKDLKSRIEFRTKKPKSSENLVQLLFQRRELVQTVITLEQSETQNFPQIWSNPQNVLRNENAVSAAKGTKRFEIIRDHGTQGNQSMQSRTNPIRRVSLWLEHRSEDQKKLRR